MNREENFLEIVIVVAATPATPCEREFIVHTFQDIQDDMAHNGKILSGIVLSHARVVFSESHIKAPVQGVLNTPMTSGCNGGCVNYFL